MDLVGDDRAQSIQIGAVLLFAVLIIAFSSYQAFIVPEQNRQVEFSHSQEVQGQMQDLRNAIVSASDSTGSTALSIRLGTRYPSRAIAVNPGPPSGTLRTVGTTDESVSLSIANAETAGETGDFWNDTQQYNTGAIAYSPQYNLYTNPPTTVYDNTVLYNAFRSGNLTVANQSFIDGNDISLVVVNGSLSRSSSGSTSVDVRPASASTQTVQLDDDGTGTNPITITFYSTRSADYWDFLETTQPNVDTVTSTGPTDGFYTVSVELATGQTYDLQLTRVGVGTQVTDEDTAYLTDTDGNGTTLSPGETTELTLEVRDRFNNPPDNASETTVSAQVAGSGSLDSTSQTPDEDGEVTFEYTAASSTGTQDVKFTYGSFDGTFGESTPQDVVMTVDVQSTGSGSGAYSVGWENPNNGDNPNEVLTSCSSTDCTWDVGAGGDGVLTLRAATNPSIEGANIDFAVDDTTLGTISPKEATTGSAGDATTELTANNNGDINVYAASGGSSKVITISMENVGGGGGGTNERVVYVDNSGTLSTIDTSGTVSTFSTGQVKAVGPFREDIDTDGDTDLPYVSNNDNLVIIDDSDNTQTLDNSGNVGSVHIGVGDWDDDSTVEVVYVRDGTLYSVADGESEIQLALPNQSPLDAGSVAGIGDFDNDGSGEIVYVDTSNNLQYVGENDGGNLQVKDTGVDVDSINAIGRLADYDDDTEIEVSYYDSTDSGIDIADDDGFDDADSAGSYDPGTQVTQAPMGAFDWTGDATPEIIWRGNNNGYIRYLNPDTGNTGVVKSEQVDNNIGVG
jgi:hypothetical protein